jgi:hypothetical protein
LFIPKIVNSYKLFSGAVTGLNGAVTGLNGAVTGFIGAATVFNGAVMLFIGAATDFIGELGLALARAMTAFFAALLLLMRDFFVIDMVLSFALDFEGLPRLSDPGGLSSLIA